MTTRLREPHQRSNSPDKGQQTREDAMFTSLFAPEVQAILDNAESAAGQPAGPFPSPADWRDQVIYFLMVDRFNNPAAAPVHQPFDDPNYGQYQGGSFAGVQQQLAYIKSLGAGAIWLSPVLKNLLWDQGSYHGYCPESFELGVESFEFDAGVVGGELPVGFHGFGVSFPGPGRDLCGQAFDIGDAPIEALAGEDR